MMCIYTLHHITLHYIPFRCVALQFITLHYITLPYITLHTYYTYILYIHPMHTQLIPYITWGTKKTVLEYLPEAPNLCGIPLESCLPNSVVGGSMFVFDRVEHRTTSTNIKFMLEFGRSNSHIPPWKKYAKI